MNEINININDEPIKLIFNDNKGKINELIIGEKFDKISNLKNKSRYVANVGKDDIDFYINHKNNYSILSDLVLSDLNIIYACKKYIIFDYGGSTICFYKGYFLTQPINAEYIIDNYGYVYINHCEKVNFSNKYDLNLDPGMCKDCFWKRSDECLCINCLR